MGAADVVVSHFTMVYIAVIVCIKVYDVVYDRNFSGGYMFVLSTTMVALIFVATLTWDLTRKPKYNYEMEHSYTPTEPPEICKGGICWHGVAEKSPVSELRITVPQHLGSL